MTSTNAIHRRPLQFSLRELFVWVTLFAIGLSIFTSRCQSIGLWLVLYALQSPPPAGARAADPDGNFQAAVVPEALLARRLRDLADCRLPEPRYLLR